jgi:hypothetical protein
MTGTGTAGAYHAGVLRALHEAGVRVDLVAGRGAGAIGALFAAVDGGQRLWDKNGLWKSKSVARAYGWRLPLAVAGWALAVVAALLCVPLLLLAGGVVAAVVAVLFALVSFSSASSAVTSGYASFVDAMFAPAVLPTIIPRLVVLCLIVAAAAVLAGAILGAWRAPSRRRAARMSVWGLLGAPLSARSVMDRTAAEVWNLIRGAAAIAPPPRSDLGRRYVDLLAENLGQPGFRELLLVAHDMDARRDVVFGLLADDHRQRFFSRSAPAGRVAEAFDLAGGARDHLMDALAATLAVPVATEPHLLSFAAEGPWRGETHRACDRPAALARLLEEAAAAGAEQVVVLSATPGGARPHELQAGRTDVRGRAGEYLAASEAADLRDALEQARASARFAAVYVIRPAHNPIGPFDFAGVYDQRSDRRSTLGELVDRGYEDAYRQFIEPVVAASGERISAVQS